MKNYAVLGLHWGLYRQRDPALVRKAHGELTALAAAGAVRPAVSEVLPFGDAVAGLTRLGAGLTTGRLVVLPPD